MFQVVLYDYSTDFIMIGNFDNEEEARDFAKTLVEKFYAGFIVTRTLDGKYQIGYEFSGGAKAEVVVRPAS